MKKLKQVLLLTLVVIIILSLTIIKSANTELKTIKSERELYNFYNNSDEYSPSLIKKILLLPFSIFFNDNNIIYSYGERKYTNDVIIEDSAVAPEEGSTTKDYSTTNIQVDNVDEADIIKTDGDYIYSISGKEVIITNVKDSENITIESRISKKGIPNDLLLYKDKLIVISSNDNVSYYMDDHTIVYIYDIKNKKKPTLLKNYELYEPYYTTRCIDGKLYVFSSGYLHEENNKIVREYIEDYAVKNIPLNDIKYLKDHKSNMQTLIAEVDLNKLNDINITSFLIDMSNAYISENNVYLVKEMYYEDDVSIKDLFGLKGVFGLFDKIENSYYQPKSEIYKFKIDSKKGIKYSSKTTTEGTTINQYSLDEKNNHLRIALDGEEGTRVEIRDKNLKLIGKTPSVAKGENMKASRFMGDKAYLVTYQNTDPLFVLDLSNEKNPKVVGELKIPGYSEYLHPYDENHLIGIGIDTEEIINKDSQGKVISTSAITKGMKMSLFDVSDVNNPKEISKTTFGDSRTTSAILSNPKALLFSKEKEILAIPVNSYKEDIETEMNDAMIKYNPYIAEGYFVYNIDLKGFNLKGIINHDKTTSRYRSIYNSKQLRGIYIEDNLYTISEDYIKVNKIKDLEEINSIKIIEEESEYER